MILSRSGLKSVIGLTLALTKLSVTNSSNNVRLLGVGPYDRKKRTHALDGGTPSSLVTMFCSGNCSLPRGLLLPPLLLYSRPIVLVSANRLYFSCTATQAQRLAR